MKRPALWLFVACWLAILLAPPLRRMLWIQLSGQSSVYQPWIYGPSAYSRWKLFTIKLRERFPDDPRVLAVDLEERGFNTEATTRGDLRQYDALIRRFPRENGLIARRLLKTLYWMQQVRIGGELSDGDLDAHKAAGIPSPEKSKFPPNFTPQDVENALAMAKLGQKREPNNAFYDEMHFYFLMMNWRDKEAWPVLSKASRKTNYDQYKQEWTSGNIAVHKLELGRPLLFEEKLWVKSTASADSYWKERELGRIVVWEAIKAGRRRGDHRQALQIYTDYARLQALHARRSYDVVESLTARALVSLALGVESQPPKAELPLRNKIPKEKWARRRAPQFARYATKHGRPDLAREMTQLRISGGQLQDKMLAKVLNPQFTYGMPARPLIRAMAVWWAAISLLLWLTLFGALWLLLGVLLRVLSLPAPAVARRDLITTVGIAVLTTALCFGVALWMGLGWQTTFLMGTKESTNSELGENLLCLLLSGIILPLGLVQAWCWEATRRRAKRQAPDEAPPLWRDRLREVRFMPLMNGVALGLLVGGAALWWMAVMVKGGGEIHFPPMGSLLLSLTIKPINPLWPLSLFAFALLASWARPIFSASAHEKPIVAYRLRWLHQSLGALCVAGSALYFLLLAASVPLRAVADAQMEQLLQRGEVALILGDSVENKPF